MISAILWLIVGAIVVVAALIAYSAWYDLRDEEDERRRRGEKYHQGPR